MDLTGKTIGNYQIIEELGRGGMAVVYRAYQPSLNRNVAIKVLPAQLAFDQQFVERFLREARAAAGLRHPNIVVIHDVGHQEGIYYIVMEYLEGRTLKQLIEEEGPQPPRRVAHIVEQIANALDYAHERGFVHRDVKPANIFVGEADRTTLTDFGIAKAASETQQLTRTGTLMGTPEYMSPEQAEGGRVDSRTDLYALGVVLYQMLVGRVPFSATTPHAVLYKHVHEPPPPPRQLNPKLSPPVESVILRAVAKRPEQRFQRGRELTAALRAAVAGKAPAIPRAAPPPPRARTAPTERRSPLVWIMVGIAAVLALLLGGLLLMINGNGGDETPTPATTQAIVENSSVPPGAPTTALPPSDSPEAVTNTPPPATEVPPPSDTPILSTDEPPPPTHTPVPPTATLPPPSPTPAAYFGRLVFTSDRDGNAEIYVLNLAGGSPKRLTSSSGNDWLPDWSPDGSRIAFTSNRTGSYDLWVMNADGSGQAAIVGTGAWDEYARWAPDGQRLSLSTTANTQGVPNSEVFVRLTDGTLVQRTSSTAEDQFADWSPDGRLVYTEGFKGDSNWDIFIVNGDGGNPTLWLGGATCDVQPTWSPNGQWIAFLRISRDTNGNGGIDYGDAGDVWVGKASGGGLRQVSSGLWALNPAWSPDSQWIAFARVLDSNGNGRSDEKDTVDIWAMPFGGGDPVPLVQSSHRDGDPSWTW